MKQWTLLTIPMAVLLFSCGGGPSKDETKTTDTSTAAVAPVVTRPPFVAYKIVSIQAKVKNFPEWKKAHDADDSLRKAYGISEAFLARELKDTNMVFAMSKMEDMDKARAFSKLPDLKEASKKSGLMGSLGFSYGEVVHENDTLSDAPARLGIAHHVKDFDAWLKAFNAGADYRASNGIFERTIARSLVDSNMVYISFAVTDTAKARASMDSPDIKKRMSDAGVDSPPTVRWYRVVQ